MSVEQGSLRSQKLNDQVLQNSLHPKQKSTAAPALTNSTLTTGRQDALSSSSGKDVAKSFLGFELHVDLFHWLAS